MVRMIVVFVGGSCAGDRGGGRMDDRGGVRDRGQVGHAGRGVVMERWSEWWSR